MEDFLSENNIAGQSLLRLVSRGNAIIAELLRLKTYIPDIFLKKLESENEGTNAGRNKKKNKEKVVEINDESKERMKERLLFDLRYINQQEIIENKIESSSLLYDVDQEFKEEYYELLNRFYLLFESEYKYLLDFQRYLEDVEEGVYIQLSIETILLDNDGKQLLAEALYVLGCILLLQDFFIPGITRERILI